MDDELLDAEIIQSGQCWRKRLGTRVYLTISESAKKFYGMDPDQLHGVSFNGNTTAVDFGTVVVRLDPSAMQADRESHAEMEVAATLAQTDTGTPAQPDRAPRSLGARTAVDTTDAEAFLGADDWPAEK